MKPVLFVQHVAWEAPHRLAEPIARALPTLTVNVLAGDELPSPRSLAGAVFMGGPMGVGDTRPFPGLLAELRWIEAALGVELPLLGVCLGAQLIAHALGSPITRAAGAELGWQPVEVCAPADPLLGALAPMTTVLHWHAEEFATPPGASLLATSERTACQAFRFADAWGVLFHAEADAALLRMWLGEPTMAADAIAALGEDAIGILHEAAARHEHTLQVRSARGFEAFADLVKERALAEAAAARRARDASTPAPVAGCHQRSAENRRST
jgi:GMP synthase (glutamine-hydrolysing)